MGFPREVLLSSVWDGLVKEREGPKEWVREQGSTSRLAFSTSQQQPSFIENVSQADEKRTERIIRKINSVKSIRFSVHCHFVSHFGASQFNGLIQDSSCQFQAQSFRCLLALLSLLRV